MTGLDNGACPDTHPVGLMHLIYEVCSFVYYETKLLTIIEDYLGCQRFRRSLD